MHLKIAFLVYFLCGCFYESLYIAGAEPQTHPPEWIPVDFSVSSLMLWNVHTARLSLQYYQSNHRGWGCLPPLAGWLSVCIGARCFSFWISIQVILHMPFVCEKILFIDKNESQITQRVTTLWLWSGLRGRGPVCLGGHGNDGMDVALMNVEIVWHPG